MTKVTEAEFKSRLSRVKLLTLDVDGVLTDGGLFYSESGEELKRFNVKDGMGMKLILEAGIEIAIITASAKVSTQYRAKKLGVTHVFLGIEDKLTQLQQLCEQLKLSLEEVAYMGDDVNDLPCLKAVGCPITVADAMPINKDCAIYVTRLNGGQGAVREICDKLLETRLA